jgi:transcriptional regulator with XRE-family HTH domain
MSTATQQLLDRIKAAHGFSDYRIAKLMGITSASVSRWRTGVGHMSQANVLRACEILGKGEDVFRWQMRIEAERELGPDGDFARRVVLDFERAARGEQLGEDSWLGILINGLQLTQRTRSTVTASAKRGRMSKRVAALMLTTALGSAGFYGTSAHAAGASCALPRYTLCEVSL